MKPLGELESEYLWLDKTCEAIRQGILGKVPLDYGKFLMRSMPNTPFYRVEEHKWIKSVSNFNTASKFDLQLIARTKTIDICLSYAEILTIRLATRDYGLSSETWALIETHKEQLQAIKNTLQSELSPQYTVSVRMM